MSFITQLTLKNAAAAALPFNREASTKFGVRLRDAAATVFSRATRITVECILPSEQGSVVKCQVQMEMPIYDAAGVLKYTFRHGKDGTFIPKDSSLAERKEFRAMITSYYASDVFIAQVENLDTPS